MGAELPTNNKNADLLKGDIGVHGKLHLEAVFSVTTVLKIWYGYSIYSHRP